MKVILPVLVLLALMLFVLALPDYLGNLRIFFVILPFLLALELALFSLKR
jgi:hypothetical protein